jgi:RimJ/RimL family protein N-acetyltransferase
MANQLDPPSPPLPIVTARLELVPLRVADADEMAGVLADPGLFAYIGGRPPTREEIAERYTAQVRGHSPDGTEAWLNWIVRERPGGAATGFIQATITGSVEGRIAEIAWLIGTPWQGRGYATEAAGAVVHRLSDDGVGMIVAHVHPDHAASATVAARVGLEPSEVFVDGERQWRLVVAEPPAP